MRNMQLPINEIVNLKLHKVKFLSTMHRKHEIIADKFVF